MAKRSRDTAENIAYTPAPTIERFMLSDAFVRGIRGPFGSGKSTGCCMEIFRQATLMPANFKGIRRSKVACIRNTYRELLDTTIKTWLERVDESCGQFHQNDLTHFVRMALPDGTVLELDVLFRALDKPDDVKKLKSLELTGAWVNEASEIPLEIIDVIGTRVGRFPRREEVKDYRAYVIMDTNPPDTDSWWYKLAEEFVPKLKEFEHKGFKKYQDALTELFRISGTPIDARHLSDAEARSTFMELCTKYEFFAQPSGLSPQAENVANLRPNYYFSESLGKTPEWVNVYVHGNYGYLMDGKPVYPEYNDSVHHNKNLVDPDSENKVIIRGWDGGRTPACIFMQMTPRGHLLVFDELIGEDIGLSEFADRVKSHSALEYHGYKFYDVGDPSIFFRSQLEDRAPNVILSAKGVELKSAGTNSPTIRKESLKKLLREFSGGIPCFQIGPKARMTRKGLMGGYQYQRKQVSGTEYHEKPKKNEYSHPVEALEYPCVHLFRNLVTDDEFSPEDLRDEGEFELSTRWKDKPVRTEAGRSSVTGY